MKNQREISFLADMGISMKTVQWLRSQGYDAIHLRERNQQRYPDPEIVNEARRENRVILTMDLDFGFLMATSSFILPSIIIFRLQDERPTNVNKHLHIVLSRFTNALKAGAVISVSENKYRVRMLPIYN